MFIRLDRADCAFLGFVVGLLAASIVFVLVLP